MTDNENPENHEAPENAEQPTDTAVSEPVPAEPAPAAEPVPAYAAPLAPQPRLRDHLFSFRSVVAVALATLLLGGAGGAALVALTNDGHDDGPRIVQRGDRPGNDQRFGGGGPGFAPPGQRNQQQDGQGTAPEPGSAS